MADVFISYASEDRERVRPLAEAFAARGFDVWWDRALAAGDDYARVIERELAAARTVIVVWTRASTQSAFVRDEAARARDQGRLVPIKLDRDVEIPLGFGSFQAEDFTGWQGAPDAPEVGVIAEVLRARLDGREADVGAIDAKRRQVKHRLPFASIAGAVVVLLGIAAGLYLVAGRTPPPRPAVEQGAQFDRILDLVAAGQLTGEQALELARLIEGRAFQANEAGDADPSVEQLAASAFESAAAELLQHPDADVRVAVVKAANASTRAAGMADMEKFGEQGGSNAAALWRALGALKLAAGAPDAVGALERARDSNPHDKVVWRMLGKSYEAAERDRDAETALLIGDGLEAAAAQDWQAATKTLERALTMADDPETGGFVQGQLGDLAVAREDWQTAEGRYRSAVEAHRAQSDTLALSVDAAKLARAQQKQGDRETACKTLLNARREGATVADAEVDAVCAGLSTIEQRDSRGSSSALDATRP